MVDWLVCRFLVWLIGWVVEWLVGRFFCLVDCLVGW